MRSDIWTIYKTSQDANTYSTVPQKCAVFEVQMCPSEMCRVFIPVPYLCCTRCHEVPSLTSRQIVFTMATVQHCVDQWPAVRANWIWKQCDGFRKLDPNTVRCDSSIRVFLCTGVVGSKLELPFITKKWQTAHFCGTEEYPFLTINYLGSHGYCVSINISEQFIVSRF